MAFLALARLALAAEGQGDNVAKQPTMAELKAKMDSISTEIAALAATVGNLSTAAVTKLDTLTTTVAANHTTIVGKFAQQMAVVMTVPTTLLSASTGNYGPTYYLVGDSSIPGFPGGTVAANGQFTVLALPAGTYLFELQHPYSNDVLCNGNVAKRHLLGGNRFNRVCPRVRLHLRARRAVDLQRFVDGPVVYDIAAGGGFSILHKFPTGFAFADTRPASSYSGAVKITKLK